MLLLYLYFMNNQSHWHQSIEDIEQDHQFSSRLSSPRDGEDNPIPFNGNNREIVQQHHQGNNQHNNSHIHKNITEGVTKTLEGKQQSMQINNNSQYVRVNTNGQRQIIKVISVNPKLPNQVPINHQITTNLPPHYPPHLPPNQKTSQFKSLDNARHITQQSFAPSQKTIVLNHTSNQGNGVYHSHVTTQRMGIQPIRQPNIRHSHIHQTRVMSPTRVNFDYGQSKQDGRNALFNSYIPTSNPIIMERVGAVSSSNAPQPSQRHFDNQEEVIFWREKYEELSRRWQALRSKETKELEVAVNKLGVLQKNYQILQNNYDELVQQYHSKLDQNQKYYQQIQQLQSTLNQRQLSPKQQQTTRLTQLLKEKQSYLKKLSSRLEQSKSSLNNPSELQSAYEQKCMLVNLLKKENEQYCNHFNEVEQKYQQQLQQMHEHATMLQMQVEQRDAQLRERTLMKNSAMRRSDNSQLLLDPSRMESFDNTRVMELEMHIGKLNSQLNMREESFERQLRMANLNVAELVDRMKAMTIEKDQTIRNLQEKIGLLESDLNKKESVIRNLRDQVSNKFTPANNNNILGGNVYSSAVNPVDHRVGQKEDAYKKEVENLRKNLFERQREKMILRQKYEQLQEKVLEGQQALGKKKVQNQAMRRQLNDFDNLQHENDKLMQMINKKNAEILEMKEMLLEKEQYAGDFQNLSKENDRLRNFMLKKNEELSEMAEKLYNQEKKVREMELSHAPRFHQFQEEIHRLNDLLNRKDVEIDKLNQSLSLLQGNYSEIEFELERKRNIGQQYEELIRSNNQKLQNYQEQIQELKGQNQGKEVQLNRVMQRMQEINEKLNEKQSKQAKALQKIEELTHQLHIREEQIHSIAQQQTQLKQFKAKSSKEIQSFQSKQTDLQLRCRDLQSLLRNREQRVVRAEKEVQQSRQQLKKHQNCTKLIEQMTEKVSNYEMKIISLTMNRGYSKINQYPQPAQVFENRIIYRLKQQNQEMRQQIERMENQLNGVKQKYPQKKEGGVSVQNRLKEFNSNLADTIGNTGGLKRVRSVQTLIPKQSVIMQQNRQIQRLKQLAQQMQREELQRSSFKKHITPQYIDLVYQQEITFYRSKNTELEERIRNLLQINKELKSTVEDNLGHKNIELKGYYQGEIKRLEREVLQLKGKRGKQAEKEKEKVNDH